MNIAFFAKYFYPHVGGVEKHVLEVSKRLVKKGHKVTVFTENLNKSYSHTDQSKEGSAKLTGEVCGIKIIRIPAGEDSKFKKFRIWKELCQYRSILKKADIIHCHDIFFWYLPYRFLFFSKPIFVTFHGYEGNEIPSKKAIFMHKLAEKLTFGNICIGDFHKKWYGTKPSFVTFGAAKKIKNNVQKERNYNNQCRIMFLGRLEEETGIMEYLKALQILKAKGFSLDLDVYGDGLLKKEAIKFSELNNLSVQFRGFISDADNFIKKYDLIFVSRYLGILEAMIHKKPVFAIYNNKIKKDYLEMSPFAKFISVTGNYKSLAGKIEYFLTNNKSTEKNIEFAYGWTKNQTWDKMIKLYLKLWSR